MKSWWWLLLALGCSTRVVQLAPPGDGGPIKCNEFLREDGATCRLCFRTDGEVTTTDCKPVTGTTVPGTSAPDAAVDPAAQICKVTPAGDSRCLSCPSGNPNSICLKCDGPVMSSSGGACRICVWSDAPMVRCLQCFADDGSTREDGCDGLRKEKLIYSPLPDGGA